jgi:hypothetical protein
MNSILFPVLCDEMGRSHNSLLFLTDSRRLYQWKRKQYNWKERYISLLVKGSIIEGRSVSDYWTTKSCYLLNTFSDINELNLTQHKGITKHVYHGLQNEAFKENSLIWSEM